MKLNNFESSIKIKLDYLKRYLINVLYCDILDVEIGLKTEILCEKHTLYQYLKNLEVQHCLYFKYKKAYQDNLITNEEFDSFKNNLDCLFDNVNCKINEQLSIKKDKNLVIYKLKTNFVRLINSNPSASQENGTPGGGVIVNGTITSDGFITNGGTGNQITLANGTLVEKIVERLIVTVLGQKLFNLVFIPKMFSEIEVTYQGQELIQNTHYTVSNLGVVDFTNTPYKFRTADNLIIEYYK